MLIDSIGGTSGLTMDAMQVEDNFIIILNDGDRSVDFEIPKYLFDVLNKFETERNREDN